MSAQVSITQLPAAGAITGTEAVPIVQNGVTVRTTTAAIAASPSQSQTFVTVNQELTLPNSRYLTTGTGLGFTDGGADSFYRVSLNGASGSLESASTGIIVKNGTSSVISRSVATSGSGLSVSNADGTGGNPTFQLTGLAQALASFGGTGFLSIVGGSSLVGRQFFGTANQLTIANSTGTDNPVFAIADNAVLPGTSSVTIPIGTTAQQPSGSNGQIRYNSSTQTFDGYSAGTWRSFTLTGGVTSFSAGTTGFSPSLATSGVVTLAGTLNVANGGTGATSLTGYVKGSGTSIMTAASTIPTTDLSGTVTNAQIANPQVTVNGTTILLGGSGTITASNPNALTFGTGFTAGSYTGATAQTINLANTGVTAGSYGLAGSVPTIAINSQGQITSASNTAIAISASQVTSGTFSNAFLTNSSLTVNGTSISLGGSGTITAASPNALTIGTGLTGTSYNGSSAVTIALAASGVTAATYGSASNVPVFAVDTYGRVTSVTNTAIAIAAGAVSGLAASATTDTTNATNITSGTLPTARLSGSYTGITGVGTLAAGTWNGTAIGVAYGGTGQTTASAAFNALSPLTTLGDIIYGGAVGAGTRLGIGTAGQVLTVNSGATAPQWSTLSGVAVTTFNAGTTGFTPSSATSGAITLAGTLITSNGGTGLTTYTAGDLPYYATGTALSKLGIGTNGQILTSSGTAPQWSTLSGVAVTTISFGTTGLTPATATSGVITVAGTLAIANGGTNSTATPTAGGVGYGTGTAHAYSVVGTSGQAFISAGASAPAFGNLGTSAGGTGLSGATPFTSGGAVYASSASVLTSGTLPITAGGTGTIYGVAGGTF